MDSESPPSTADNGSGLSPQVLAELATGLWRMRSKMVDAETMEPLEEMTSVHRHLESMWDTLTEAGVQIHDHNGEVFISGKSLLVLAFQPTLDVDQETVIETIAPTIFLHESCIQVGEVIVGTPEQTESTSSTEPVIQSTQIESESPDAEEVQESTNEKKEDVNSEPQSCESKDSPITHSEQQGKSHESSDH